MTPDQIQAVRRTWSAALRDTDALVSWVASSLTRPGEEVATGRARWAVDSITRLVLVLDRPTAFTAVAEAEIARLPQVTLAALDEVQQAALGAVRTLTEGIGTAEEHAWTQAFALFHELVAAQHLSPFRPPPVITP